MPLVALTVDLEPDCPPFLSGTFRGVTEGFPDLLALLREEEVPTTVFCTGDVAQRFPGAVEQLLAQGHELACHGQTHRALPDLSPAEVDEEIGRSAEILRRFSPVDAFRAPYLRLPDEHLPLVAAHGFRVDCSGARYKWGGTRPGPPGLRRIPASVTSSVLRLPRAVRDPWLASLRDPVVLFVHPWEFVDLRRTRLRYDCRFRTGEPALDALRTVIRDFRTRGGDFRLIHQLPDG
jgi:peptidoglycan-N-acetylglucosamine deacetylase